MQLIERLCPNGVEYKKLEECCNILDSKRKPITRKYREKGDIPYYGANGIQDYVKDYIFEGKYVLVGEDGSVINKNGTPVVTYAEGKIWVNNHAHIIEENGVALLRYLYHYIQTIDITVLVHGAIPKLNQGDFKNFEIPIPPLEVQKKIAEVLDLFSENTEDLQKNLTKELELRKKQYEYYRDDLLRFPEGSVEYKQIKEVAQRIKGTAITAGTMKKIADERGNIKIFAGGKTAVMAQLKDIPNAKITEKPSVIVQSRGIVNFIYYDKPFTFKNEMWAYTVDNTITLKYLYYVLKNNVEYFRELANKKGAMPQIATPDTDNFKIPIPSIEKQKQIVEILEPLEKLTQSLTEGIPAEIEGRKKQYEYYRNLLLDFKRKEN